MREHSKILIIEDEMLLAWPMHEVLSLVGYDVVGVAATVSDALCLAENTRPDLAIVDVSLAGRRDGIEGAELLRKQLGTEVIFLTAQGDDTTAQRACALDPAGFLVKPVHSQQLVRAIRRVLDTVLLLLREIQDTSQGLRCTSSTLTCSPSPQGEMAQVLRELRRLLAVGAISESGRVIRLSRALPADLPAA